MTENGDPLETAIAERVNGILKSEWLNKNMPDTKWETAPLLAGIIHAYNFKRPHLSINMLTPAIALAHTLKGELNRKWKSYYQKNKINVLKAELVNHIQDE